MSDFEPALLLIDMAALALRGKQRPNLFEEYLPLGRDDRIGKDRRTLLQWLALDWVTSARRDSGLSCFAAHGRFTRSLNIIPRAAAPGSTASTASTADAVGRSRSARSFW